MVDADFFIENFLHIYCLCISFVAVTKSVHKNMNKRQARLSQIVNILLHNQVGSQEELMDELKARNCEVTQATLSRDLKTLRTSKVVTEMGGYRYVIAANGTAADEVATHAMDTVRQAAVLSLAFTGNLAVIKTRNGYAGGLDYDIDEVPSPLVLGTIAGADTVFVALAENAPKEDVLALLATVLPQNVIDKYLQS